MEQVSTIGLDIAKNVFQVHGIDETGEVIVRRQLRRRQVLAFFGRLSPCLIGMEACATSHHWARELTKLGHKVRLMPPRYVKPYVKRNKNDAADAEAINMRQSPPTDVTKTYGGHVDRRMLDQREHIVPRSTVLSLTMKASVGSEEAFSPRKLPGS